MRRLRLVARAGEAVASILKCAYYLVRLLKAWE